MTTNNVTQCCVQQNVTAGCLDACSSSYLDINVAIGRTDCFNDFDKLMKCASGMYSPYGPPYNAPYQLSKAGVLQFDKKKKNPFIVKYTEPVHFRRIGSQGLLFGPRSAQALSGMVSRRARQQQDVRAILLQVHTSMLPRAER